ncbi:MAG: entry exclusion lipoprotein TrbK [Candidatus Accumulibacter sp.]|jgi:entry exclusion lipoprotein TrbK|nr:entry exclusion lipoprotein TrbK [Accumulibacter sp.]
MKTNLVLIVLLSAFAFAGCGNKLEVNAENCNPYNGRIREIEDKDKRVAFIEQCKQAGHTAGWSKPSSGIGW